MFDSSGLFRKTLALRMQCKKNCSHFVVFLLFNYWMLISGTHLRVLQYYWFNLFLGSARISVVWFFVSRWLGNVFCPKCEDEIVTRRFRFIEQSTSRKNEYWILQRTCTYYLNLDMIMGWLGKQELSTKKNGRKRKTNNNTPWRTTYLILILLALRSHIS